MNEDWDSDDYPGYAVRDLKGPQKYGLFPGDSRPIIRQGLWGSIADSHCWSKKSEPLLGLKLQPGEGPVPVKLVRLDR